MTQKRFSFLVSGCLSLASGCIGIVLLILPTVPFFLLTVFCFANSSQKRHEDVPEAPGILRPEKGHDSKGQKPASPPP